MEMESHEKTLEARHGERPGCSNDLNTCAKPVPIFQGCGRYFFRLPAPDGGGECTEMKRAVPTVGPNVGEESALVTREFLTPP